MFGADTQYEATEMLIHSGSEHTIDGKRYDLELQFVHKAKDKENDFPLAIVSVLFSDDDYNIKMSHEETGYMNQFFNEMALDESG